MKTTENMENLQIEKEYNLKFSYLVSPQYFPEHWHEFVEFILSTADESLYSVNDVVYTLNKGDILLIWPGELHSNVSVPSGTSIVMQFGDNFIYSCHDLTLNYRYLRNYHKIGVKEMPELNHILSSHITQAYQIFSSLDPFAETSSTIQIYSMLLSLGSYALKDIGGKDHTYGLSNPSFVKIKNACAYISQNCEKELTQKEVARRFGFSHFYFSRLFKEYTFTTFNEYLSKERLHRATKLLCEESIPITEVAYLSGFQSISNFNRVFSKTMHHSPTEYRKMYNGSLKSSHQEA